MEQEWIACLQEAGYRVTAPRRAVLRALAESARPLSPAELRERGRRYYPSLGLVTVYRTLEVLEGLDLVRRVHREDGCHAYAPTSAGHVHLILCQRCNRAAEFSGDDLAYLIAQVERETGYRVQGHWLQLFGLCPQCREG